VASTVKTAANADASMRQTRRLDLKRA